jgi:hypothetical protein
MRTFLVLLKVFSGDLALMKWCLWHPEIRERNQNRALLTLLLIKPR